jgi:hypothetical protein
MWRGLLAMPILYLALGLACTAEWLTKQGKAILS